MGFGSQARLNVHLQHHEKQWKNPMAHMAHLADSDDNKDVELILLDAVKQDDLDLVRDFIADVPRFSGNMVSQAVVSSSGEMLELLLETCNSKQIKESNVMVRAVKADNLEATRMLLNRGDSIVYTFDWQVCMNLAMDNRSPNMIRLLLSYKSGPEISNLEIVDLIPQKPDISEEARVVQCLGLLRDWTKMGYTFNYDRCFIQNAERCCSIAIAEFLLQHGVHVNTFGRDRRSRTALYCASGSKSQRCAEFMKFLLESGADPIITPRNRRPIADKPGPRNISKWFGISWEQLVEESHKKHAASFEMKSQ